MVSRDNPALRHACLCAATTALGFALAKVGALIALSGEPVGWDLVPSILVSFVFDLAVLVGVGVLAGTIVRSSRSRLLRAIPVLISAALGLYAVINVYFVFLYGAPFSARFWVLRVGAEQAAELVDPVALGVTFGLIVVYIVSLLRAAWLGHLLAELSLRFPRRLAVTLPAYLVLGWLTVGWLPRTYGLERNAITELVGSLLPTSVPSLALRAGVELHAPDPSFVEPIRWNRDAPRPKHVVLWIGEGIAPRHMGLYQPELDTTPNLNRLARHSLRFEHYYTNAPISIKALFNIYCGLYPYPQPEYITHIKSRIACPSFSELLTAAGYDAALFHGGYFDFTDKLKLFGDRGFDLMVDAFNIPDRRSYWFNGWGIDDQALVDHALRWLDSRSNPDQPSFTMFVPISPHFPYFLPKRLEHRIKGLGYRDKYRQGVRFTDDLFGQLYDAYRERGLARDTLFIFLGDHGQAFSEHPRNRLHGLFLYEENVHAPLVLFNEQLFDGPLVSDRLGSHVDLLPTVLDLLGLPAPDELPGQSLVTDDFEYRPALFGTHFKDRLLGLRDGDNKLIWNIGNDKVELYDLSADPRERNNIAADAPERVADYRAVLAEAMAEHTETIDDYPVLGPEYLREMVRTAKVSIVDGDSVVRCDRRDSPTRLSCPGEARWMWVGIEPLRIANMVRECIHAHVPNRGRLRIEVPAVSPPPKIIGAGLPDAAARAGGDPLHVRWLFDGEELVEMELPDERSYRAMLVNLDGDSVSLTVELWADSWNNRTACFTLAP